MKYLSLPLIIIFAAGSIFAQDQIINIQRDVNLDTVIVRPAHVSRQAHLFKSNQDQFMVYFWVEYQGIVDADDLIHKVRLYEQDGRKYRDIYYFALGDIEINKNEYLVDNALSNVISISSNGKKIELYVFNYHKENARSGKKNYVTTALESNPNFTKIPGVSKLSHMPDVSIKIEKSGKNYLVSIQNEFGKIDKAIYQLICDDLAPTVLVPKYYYFSENRIYLLHNNCYLQKIN